MKPRQPRGPTKPGWFESQPNDVPKVTKQVSVTGLNESKALLGQWDKEAIRSCWPDLWEVMFALQCQTVPLQHGFLLRCNALLAITSAPVKLKPKEAICLEAKGNKHVYHTLHSTLPFPFRHHISTGRASSSKILQLHRCACQMQWWCSFQVDAPPWGPGNSLACPLRPQIHCFSAVMTHCKKQQPAGFREMI